MKPNFFFYNTAFLVRLAYIAGHSLLSTNTTKNKITFLDTKPLFLFESDISVKLV